jgi:hypothetical protein
MEFIGCVKHVNSFFCFLRKSNRTEEEEKKTEKKTARKKTINHKFKGDFKLKKKNKTNQQNK